MTTLLFAPGYNRAGDPLFPMASTLAVTASEIAAEEGWGYHPLDLRLETSSLKDATEEAASFLEECLEHQEDVVVLTTSLGAWPILLALRRRPGLVNVLLNVVMVGPVYTTEFEARKLGVLRKPMEAFARNFFWWRPSDDSGPGFKVPAYHMRQLLDPELDLYHPEALSHLAHTVLPDITTILVTGSRFSPHKAVTALVNRLGGIAEDMIRELPPQGPNGNKEELKNILEQNQRLYS